MSDSDNARCLVPLSEVYFNTRETAGRVDVLDRLYRIRIPVCVILTLVLANSKPHFHTSETTYEGLLPKQIKHATDANAWIYCMR